MKTVMVRYKVKSDRADENVRYIEAVFAELAQSRPGGLHYASFRLADGLSFVHVAGVDTADGSNPLTALETFKAFTSAIRDRCEEPPATTDLEPVGTYRLFESATGSLPSGSPAAK